MQNKMPRVLLLVLIITVVPASAFAQSASWFAKLGEIKILSDSREDLFEKFGVAKKTAYSPRIETYEFDKGTLSFLFTVPTCERSPGRLDHVRWNVPENTIEEVTFYFSEDSKYPSSNLALDLSDFEQFIPFGKAGEGEYVGYEDQKLGLRYVMTVNGLMRSINYFPNLKRESEYLCQN